MAATPGVKSQGMKFAEEQLQRHGWTEGKGLGKRESGISEAIKVKVKCDTAGVGHNSAEQFTFHWWDHVFNKTASSISVESNQDGVQVKKVTDDDSVVTNKKPRKALTNRDMLYGRFIKSATLLSGGEEPVEKESPNESSSDSSEDEKLNLSSAAKLTDEDLVKICGGRTAHKGARHGLTMNAKLLRIEEQERAFLEKYRKKETTKEPVKPICELFLEKDTETRRKKEKHRQGITDEDILSNTTQRKKKKRREKNLYDEEDGTNAHEGDVPWKEDYTVTSKRNVDRKLVDVLGGVSVSNKTTVDEDTATELNHGHLIEKDLKYSKKKSKKVAIERVKEAHNLEDHARAIEDDAQSTKRKKKKIEEEQDELREELLNGHQEWAASDDARPSKKKKKLRKDLEERVEEERDECTEECIKPKKKKKKQKKVEEVDEHMSVEEEEHQTTKKKKSKNKYKDCTTPEEEPEQAVDGNEHEIKLKKNKKNLHRIVF